MVIFTYKVTAHIMLFSISRFSELLLTGGNWTVIVLNIHMLSFMSLKPIFPLEFLHTIRALVWHPNRLSIFLLLKMCIVMVMKVLLLDKAL